MRDDDFEWDDAKARMVFSDPLALDWLDDREDYGEARYITLGQASHRLLHVAYTLRDHRIRIITARAAAPQERRVYHEGKP